MSASSIVYNLCSDPPEAFGRTVPEALCLGVPVIAWNHGGVREILQELFPLGAVDPDNLPALIQKTRDFLEQPPTVENSDAFSLQHSMEQTMSLYQAALEKEDG
jgi:glycosyltransferase involved in cell wall biosynthesis